MRISSDYYYNYYYNSGYGVNSASPAAAAISSQASQDSTGDADDVTKLQSTRRTSGYGNAMNLSINGSMMRYSLQNAGTAPADISDKLEAVKSDMDSIKSADIDSMSAEEVKETLSKLKTDMEAMPRPDGSSGSASKLDLDSMSETDMRDMLKKLQENIQNMPMMGPPPQSPGSSGDFGAIKEDLDAIKSADLDSITTDKMKELLSNLQNSLKTTTLSDTNAEKIESADLDSMSGTDMKQLLEDMQEQLNNPPQMPPRGMGGFDPSQLLNGVSANDTVTGTSGSSADTEELVMQIVDKLTEDYDSSTQSSEDYATKLKEALQTMFSQQKNNIDQFSGMMFDRLDAWSSGQQSSSEAI